MSKAKTEDFYIDRLIFDPRWVEMSRKIYSYLPIHLREPQHLSVENDTWKFDPLDEAGEGLNVYFKPIDPKEPSVRMLEAPNGNREILDLTTITSGWNTFGFTGSRKELFEVIFKINETTNTMGCISCCASDQPAGGIENKRL